MSDLNLATIRVVKSLEPIEGADKIELCRFEDICWQSVVKKGQFSIGEKVIYVQIDTVLPDGAAWAQFLKNNSAPNEPIRLKTVKLRGALSQGLVLPIMEVAKLDHDRFADEIQGEVENFYLSGTDVTEILGIKKYEKPIPVQLSGQVKGNFPQYMRITDEERIQNVPNVLSELVGKEIYISLKMDGTSFSCYNYNDEFGVCSRKLNLKPSDENSYWRIARELDLETKIKSLGNVAIQAELCGPAVQKNKIGLTKPTLYVFNVWDIDNQKFFGYDTLIKVCSEFGLNHVPVLYKGMFDPSWDISYFLNFADQQKYPNGSQAEGIVVRTVEETYSNVLKGRLSFKTISNKFALKHGE